MNPLPAPNEGKDSYNRRLKITQDFLNQKEKLATLIPGKIKKKEGLYYFRSNNKLPFWTGAYTWIIEIEKGINVPIVQLPTKKRRLTFTTEEEIFNHEKIHTLRAAYHEPLFEEILAYQTSNSKWRRFFGPLFSTQKQSLLFMTSLLTTPFAPLFPAALFLLFFLRLAKRQHQFYKAYQNLPPLLRKYMILLSDKEIIAASKNDLIFLENDNLRMKLIKELTEAKKFNIQEKNNPSFFDGK